MDRGATEIYDVFVSYNRADVEFAERLVRRIEQEPYRERHLRCFYAPWDIEPGENILLKIENALLNSSFVGLIMSPEWLKSDWTTLERVIPVHEDPAGMKSRIIPILRRNCGIPPSIRILKWLDFRTESNFEREMNKLLARIKGLPYRTLLRTKEPTRLPTESLDSITPEIQVEFLPSNLFQVTEMPRYVNRARARVRSRGDVWDMLGNGVALPVFAMREDSHQIFSFAPFKDSQQKLIKIVEDVSENKIAIIEILSSSESSVVIELLNRAMTNHMKSIGMVYDWRNKKTFFPLEKDGDVSRYAVWKVGGREYSRFVVRRSPSGRYYVHRSCKATFTKMGDHLFLKILPGWHFTTDGILQPVSQRMMGSLSSRWMNLQRNHSILDDVRFWSYRLSKGTPTIEMNVGVDSLVAISTVPLSVAIDRGIEEDYRERLWLEEEPTADESERMLEEAELEEIEEEMEEDEL